MREFRWEFPVPSLEEVALCAHACVYVNETIIKCEACVAWLSSAKARFVGHNAEMLCQTHRLFFFHFSCGGDMSHQCCDY